MTYGPNPELALSAIDRFLAAQRTNQAAWDHNLTLLGKATVVCEGPEVLEAARFYALGVLGSGQPLEVTAEFQAMAQAVGLAN
jgi:hypothetical protein